MNHLMIFSTVLVFLSLPNGSLSCRFHEQNLSDVEQIVVQAFKKKLLKELGFSSVPNISKIKAPKIPSFYKHLIEAENRQPTHATELDEDDFHAKTKRLFLFPEKGKFFLQRTILKNMHLPKKPCLISIKKCKILRGWQRTWGPLFPAVAFCKHSWSVSWIYLRAGQSWLIDTIAHGFYLATTVCTSDGTL